MQVIRGLKFEPMSGVVLTIGNFDGVHRGHQAILAAGRRRAKAARTQFVAVTFDPHPLAVLTPERPPAVLTPIEEKLRCLEHSGVDVVVVLPSSPAFLQLEADDFITDIIVDRFSPGAIVEGASFGFGRHREGGVDTLKEAAVKYGFEVEVVEPVRIALGGHPDAVISSSLVRQLLGSGTVDQAAICLGRPYTLLGRVVQGAGRGAKMGFPTANIDPGGQLVPSEAVYAGRGETDGRSFAAAISIGRAETFGGHSVVVEAHLLGFAGSLYDKPIRIEFLEWLRPQVRYSTSEELCEQMDKDVAQTRTIVMAHL